MPTAPHTLDVIVRPLITEKATRLGGETKYAFEVRKHANKSQVKEAVEKWFGVTGPSFDEITRKKPEKSLVKPLRKQGGRNNQGRITVRHRGGGAKRRLRIIDFKRNKFGVPGKVVSIEYDPNRSARIALVQYVDGEKRYILWPVGVKVGDSIMSGPEAEIKPGNALPLTNIPLG